MRVTVAVGGRLFERAETRACTICSVCSTLTRQSKNRSISVAPRAVTDFTRAMPGIPLMASSMGFVTVIIICCAGTSPFSTTMMMRGKFV